MEPNLVHQRAEFNPLFAEMVLWAKMSIFQPATWRQVRMNEDTQKCHNFEVKEINVVPGNNSLFKRNEELY